MEKSSIWRSIRGADTREKRLKRKPVLSQSDFQEMDLTSKWRFFAVQCTQCSLGLDFYLEKLLWERADCNSSLIGTKQKLVLPKSVWYQTEWQIFQWESETVLKGLLHFQLLHQAKPSNSLFSEVWYLWVSLPISFRGQGREQKTLSWHKKWSI